MSKGQKLIQKLSRKSKDVRQAVREFDRHDKIFKREELMQDSPKVHSLVRGIQRRQDSDFGREVASQRPKLSFQAEASAFERIDFGVSDFGMKMTMDADVLAQAGTQAGDFVKILEGSAKGSYLQVVSVESSTEIRLDDIASFGGAESDIRMRMDISAEKPSFS